MFFQASFVNEALIVSDVVLNRVESTKYPNNICDVVHQGYKKGKRTCQFSWFCDGKADTPKDITSWNRSRKYARDITFRI